MKKKEILQARLIGLMEKERTTVIISERESLIEQIHLLKWVLY